jgi:hypothetical protein
MTRPATPVVLILLVAILLAFLAPAGPLQSQDEVQAVRVTNFPATQQVAGSISVEGVIRHSTTQRLREILVSPVGPRETTRLIQAGTLATDGFTSVVLSLAGQTRAKAARPGAVGALLIPDDEAIVQAFEDEGLAQFPIEIAAPAVTGASLHFASSPERFTIAFPRYRVFLYNTTDKTASVNLYAYLTH